MRAHSAAEGPLFFGPHAVQRFIERFGAPRRRALRDLIDLSRGFRIEAEKPDGSPFGDVIWRGQRVRLVLSPTDRVDGLPIVRTVERPIGPRWHGLEAELSRTSDLWAWQPVGAPTHLPGLGADIAVGERRYGLTTLAGLRSLVGCRLRRVAARDHELTLAPRPSSSGWGCYWHRAADAEPILRGTWDLDGERVTFGPRLRPRAPSPRETGAHEVRITTRTPVVLPRGVGLEAWSTPTTDALLRALSGQHADVAGLGYVPRGVVALELLDADTRGAVVDTGRSGGRVAGWIGAVTIRTSALGAYLAEAAATVGLGSRTSRGFGAERVEVVS